MNRSSLVWKLTLAFLLVAIIAAALVAVLIRLTSVSRLQSLIVDQQRSVLQSELERYYTETGSWRGVADSWGQLLFRTRPYDGAPENLIPNPQFDPVPDFRDRRIEVDRRSLLGLADEDGQVIVPVDAQYPAGAVLPASALGKGTPVVVNGNQVGTILTAQSTPRLNPEEDLFLRRLNGALILAAIGAMLVALLIGGFLARTLIHPLQALTNAAQNITRGNLEQQVNVRSTDEIGQLASAFNAMSAEVARVNVQRKQMTADIAHDLRTPLTVISGYVEAMRDGVLKPTPERLALIYSEIERLQTLVDDLKMLSQVDAGELPLHPQSIDPRSLLEHASAPFQHRAAQQQVRLLLRVDENLPPVHVDELRMMQVFGNLLTNALRYTPSGGQIQLGARNVQGSVELSVEDSGVGIASEDLPFIFDRFRRADKSRHAESGEAGLGLSIVKALVEAHSGKVWAESNLGEGTKIIIRLPQAHA